MSTELVRQETGVMMPSRELKFLELQAAQIAGSSLAGQYQGQPQNVLPILVRGAELGLKPMTSLAYLYVIEGQVYPASKLLAALFRARGHWYRVIEYGAEKCVIKFRHRDDREEDTLTVPWTIEDARRAGLLDVVWKRWSKTEAGKRFCADQWTEGTGERPAWAKAGTRDVSVSKRDPWHKDPATMLFNRTVRKGVEMVDPSVTMALPESQMLEEATTAVADATPGREGPVIVEGHRVIEGDVIDAETADVLEAEAATLFGAAS